VLVLLEPPELLLELELPPHPAMTTAATSAAAMQNSRHGFRILVLSLVDLISVPPLDLHQLSDALG
jgi:hypothetical protein